jgi:pimeloyl-ACP methyl ester carboxylesterase
MSHLSNFHHRIYGPPEGRKWVFLHGLMGFYNNWHKIITYLEKTECCLTYDQRGHGRSMKPEHGYTPEDYADDLLKIIDELHWEKIILVGHSMGGRNALSFASQHSDRLTKLVIEDIAPSDKNPEGWRYFERLLGSVPTPFKSRTEAREFFQGPFKEINKNDKSVNMLSAYLYANVEEKPDGRVSWRFSPEGVIESAKVARTADRWDLVPKIKVPTLWVRGENSGTLDREDFEKVLSINPLIQGVEIKDAGHWVHADQPLAFVEAIKQFVGGFS